MLDDFFLPRAFPAGDAGGFARLPAASSPSPDIIACPDFPRFATYAEFAAAVEKLRTVAPDTGIGGTPVGRLGCVGSPAPVTFPDGPLPAGVPPLLGVGAADGDALATGRVVKQVRGSATVVYDGPGHGVYLIGNPCITAHVNRYLVARVVPPPGSRCAKLAG